MCHSFLFPNAVRLPAGLLFFPTLVVGFLSLSFNWEPSIFNSTLPAILPGISGESGLFESSTNNLWDEFIAVIAVISGVLFAFSKNKVEDEMIRHLRMESLVWATYINYMVLLLSIILVYDIVFFWVLIFNMYTILIIFSLRFHWKLRHLQNA